MPDTEMETMTPTKLALIARRAREEPRCRFTSLAHLLDAVFLKACYLELGRDRASGIDNVTWEHAQPVHVAAGRVSFTEEPDVGNPQVRFCEGH